MLLIEDDDRLAQLIGEYLNSDEFSVTIVRRGDTASGGARFVITLPVNGSAS